MRIKRCQEILFSSHSTYRDKGGKALYSVISFILNYGKGKGGGDKKGRGKVACITLIALLIELSIAFDATEYVTDGDGLDERN